MGPESMSAGRHNALLEGKDRYFTGRPCKNGHIAFRYAQSGTCSACMAEAKAKFSRTKFKKAGLLTSREFPTAYAKNVDAVLRIMESPLNLQSINERAAINALLDHAAKGGSIAGMLFKAAWGVDLPPGVRLALPPEWGLDLRV